MGDKIEFPKNYERFLLKGTELMNNGNTQKAAEFFEKAYELKKEKISNTLYTSVLYELGEYDRAVEVAEEMLQLYEENEYRYIFYATVLIKSQKFLQAEVIIKKQLNENSPFFVQWSQLEQALETEKEKVSKAKKQKEQQLLKRLYAAGDLSLEEQLYLMEEAKILPPRLQRNGCKAVLQNPFAAEITKTAALHYLKDLNESNVVDFLWFENMRSVRPADLYSLEEHPLLNQVRAELMEKTKYNPSLSEMVLQEAELHFMQMYPFVEEVITHPVVWARFYIEQFGGEDFMNETEETKEEARMRSWFKQLTNDLH